MGYKNKKRSENSFKTIGVTSKSLEFLFRFPGVSLAVLIATVGLLVISNVKELLLYLKVFLPFSLGVYIFIRSFHNNACYKMDIDNRRKLITFYKMFNQEIYKGDIDEISIIIKRTINIMIGNNTFIISINMFNELLDEIPEATEIVFRGIFSKGVKNELNRKNERFKEIWGGD